MPLPIPMRHRALAATLALLAALTRAGEGGKPPAVDDLPPIRPAATDWPWWRGERFDGIATAAKDPPIAWGKTENVVWRVDVPGRGHGSTTLWGDRIFLATADEKEKAQYVLAFDRRDGKKLWQAEVHRGGFMRMHPKNSHASATPACDGERVFMPFIVQGGIWLDALDLDGKIVWQKRLGDFESMHGFAASPVFYKSLVIVVADAIKNSFIVAVHRKTGEVAWRIDRPSYKLGTYASPSVGRIAGRDQLLIQGPYKLFSYDPATGKELWTCDGPDESTCSNPSFDAQFVWAAAGFPKRNLMCVRADGTGDVTKTHLVWTKRDNMAYVPSMILADGLLYMVEDEGRLYAFEARAPGAGDGSGDVVWETKLAAKFSASPVLAAGRIYVTSEAGVTYVYKPGRKFDLLAQNDLGDGGFATPVFVGDRIYLRTLHSLYCLGRP